MSIRDLFPSASHRRKPKRRPPMPKLGPIARRPFNAQAAREAAGEWAYEGPTRPNIGARS